MSDVTITYKGSPIATMDASGTKTLTTQGKYCEANIGVEYIKPSGGSIQFPVIRQDAELVQRTSVDRLLIADDGATLPEVPTDAKVDLVASEQLPDITVDLTNYKYFVSQRTIAYPIYSTSEIGRGRFEYGICESSYETLALNTGEFVSLVDSNKSYSSSSIAFVGVSQTRGLYFTATTGSMGIYTSATYGLYTSPNAPSLTGSAIRLSTPVLSARCQANIYDEPFWNITTDIRYQYIIEVWRVPKGTNRDMDGWPNMMQMERALGCVLSPSHTLT